MNCYFQVESKIYEGQSMEHLVFGAPRMEKAQFSLQALGFVELVAQSRALLMMRHRKNKAEHAYGLCRAPVVSRIGFAGSLG